MEFGRAFTYFFNDRNLTSRLVTGGLIAFLATISTPLLVGLVGWAALAGYQSVVTHNLRSRSPNPLPRWEDLGDLIARGANILVAFLVYNLVNLAPVCCLFTTSVFFNTGIISSTVNLVLVCCLLPMLLLYNGVAWPMFALALARYADERNIGAFFQFGDLFATLYRRLGVTLQWLLYALLMAVAFAIIFAVPCIGWAIAPILLVPVYAYLCAALADRVEDQPRLRRTR